MDQEHRKNSPSPVVDSEPTGKVNNKSEEIDQKILQKTVQKTVQTVKPESKGSLIVTKKIHTEIEYIVEDEWTEPDVTESMF